MSDKAKVFRSSMSGFNKEDVNRYIIDINNEFSAKEEEYKRELRALTDKLSAAEERLSAASVAEAALEEEKTLRKDAEDSLASLQAQLDLAVERITALESELSEASEKLTASEGSASALEAKCRELEAALAEAEANAKVQETVDTEADINDTLLSQGTSVSENEKIKLYDQISSQIGDIIINANSSADEIIRKAEAEAASIASASARFAEESHDRLKGLTDVTVSSLKRDLFTGLEACMREFKSYSNEVSATSKNLISDLEKKHAALTTKLEYFSDTLEKRMSTKVRDFNGKCNSIRNSFSKSSDK